MFRSYSACVPLVFRLCACLASRVLRARARLSWVAAPVQAELTTRGHQIKVGGFYDDSCGGGQAVLRDFAAGVNYGASDPRKDGAAIPQLMRGE